MMISEHSVRRPVFATVISLLLVILGLAAMTKLPVRQYPDVDSPVVSVEVSYRGASAEVVETKVTQVIEDAVSGIEGIEKLTSTSCDERSDVRIEFALDRDIDGAANDVRDRVSRVVDQLPTEADAAGDRQGRQQHAVGHVAEPDLGPHVRPGNYRLCRPLPGGPLFNRFRRRPGAHFRRASLRHAHLAGPGKPGGPRPDRE